MHIAFLRLVEVAVADIIDKTVEKPADAGESLSPASASFSSSPPSCSSGVG